MNIKNIFIGKGKTVKIILMVVLVIIVLTIILQSFVFINKNKTENKNKLTSISMKSLQLTKVQEQSVVDDIENFGEITFFEKVSVSSKVNGKLEKIYIKEGQIVKRGDVLAQVERLPLELTLKQQNAELEMAKTSYTLAQAKYENALKSIEIKLKTIEKAKADLEDKRVSFENTDRILNNKKKLYEAGGVSESELKSIQAQHTTMYTHYKLAQSDLEIQEVGFRDVDLISAGYKVPKNSDERMGLLKKINTKMELAELDAANSRIKQVNANITSTKILLDETTIRSPFVGVVASKNMEAGELIKPESIIANLISISKVYLVLNIPEKDIRKIKNGQKVKFAVDALENKQFEGIVTNITPVLDLKTRTVAIKILVDNQDKNLMPGMFARATIFTGQKENKKLIPLVSVMEKNEGKGVVYIIKKNIVFKQEVELGKEYKDQIEVTKGLDVGDEVISSGANMVYSGLKVDNN